MYIHMYTIVCIEKNILLPLNIEGESQSVHINRSVFMMCLVGGGGSAWLESEKQSNCCVCRLSYFADLDRHKSA